MGPLPGSVLEALTMPATPALGKHMAENFPSHKPAVGRLPGARPEAIAGERSTIAYRSEDDREAKAPIAARGAGRPRGSANKETDLEHAIACFRMLKGIPPKRRRAVLALLEEMFE